MGRDRAVLPRQRWFEDFAEGEIWESRSVTVTESAIVDFALHYDPQIFHMDSEGAARSLFGGLIASGWHVAALSFGLIVRTGFFGDAAMGSPGLQELSWKRPVRPGDSIRTRATVESIRNSDSRDDRGYAIVRFEVLNQDDDVVMTYSAREILARRPKR